MKPLRWSSHSIRRHITGQDGAYLADFLLGKEYEVHGIKRRASSFNTARVDHLYQDPHEKAEYTANSDALGPLRLLEAVRIVDMTKRVCFYQASTSELFGKVQEIPQTEKTPFYPAEFIYENLLVEINVIHAAYVSGVKKLLFMGSSCIYPRECPQPIMC